MSECVCVVFCVVCARMCACVVRVRAESVITYWSISAQMGLESPLFLIFFRKVRRSRCRCRCRVDASSGFCLWCVLSFVFVIVSFALFFFECRKTRRCARCCVLSRVSVSPFAGYLVALGVFVCCITRCVVCVIL